MLEDLKPIVFDKPVDLIIDQIRALISSGAIKPGDKLPSERKLAEHLGVSRGQIREAIGKLEFYGILKTLPQSGTMVSGLGLVALEGLINDVLELDAKDFGSLVEARVLLEKEAAYLAAKRRTDKDIKSIEKALEAYEAKRLTNDVALDEDFMFHLKIAEASKNSVLRSLMIVITPDLLANFKQLEVCDATKNKQRIEEHRNILKFIIDGDAQRASTEMINHLSDIVIKSRSSKP
jgi:GntR family transcriptional regulator, transcriptional repressor for pyruvate dehydrogenase complex